MKGSSPSSPSAEDFSSFLASRCHNANASEGGINRCRGGDTLVMVTYQKLTRNVFLYTLHKQRRLTVLSIYEDTWKHGDSQQDVKLQKKLLLPRGWGFKPATEST